MSNTLIQNRGMFKPSPQQEAIFKEVIFGTGNVGIEAGPGSGKTTTIVEASKLIPYGANAIFIAFNNSIVNELRERLPDTVICSTIHSIGMKAIMAAYDGNKAVQENKQLNFIEPLLTRIKDQRDKYRYMFAIDTIVSLIRASDTPLDKEKISQMLADHNIVPDEDTHILKAIKAVREINSYNQKTNKQFHAIDFIDMIECPAKYPWVRLPKYDYIFLDEAQDTSKLDQSFIKKMMHPRTRLIFVGDPKQSIYSFRGADVESFESISSWSNTKIFPLSVSFRCGKKIIDHAKELYDNIEAFESNPPGTVMRGRISDIEDGDMVVCRTSEPLIHLYMKLVSNEVKCTIVGKDIEKGLLSFISRYKNMSMEQCIRGIKEDHTSLFNTLRGKGIKNPKNHKKMISFEEKSELISVIGQYCDDVDEVEEKIDEIFNGSDQGVKLMTIHKSKGLEADRVFILDEFKGKKLIPNKFAVTDKQLLQEKNLDFVARTRAKKSLIRISLDL